MNKKHQNDYITPESYQYADRQPYPQYRRQRQRPTGLIAAFVVLVILGCMFILLGKTNPGDSISGGLAGIFEIPPTHDWTKEPLFTITATGDPNATATQSPVDYQATVAAIVADERTATARANERAAAITEQYVARVSSLQQTLDALDIERAGVINTQEAVALRQTLDVATAQANATPTPNATGTIEAHALAIEIKTMDEQYQRAQETRRAIFIILQGGGVVILILVSWAGYYAFKRAIAERDIKLDKAVTENESQRADAIRKAISKWNTERQAVLDLLSEMVRIDEAAQYDSQIFTHRKLENYSAEKWTGIIAIMKQYRTAVTSPQGTFLRYGTVGNLIWEINNAQYPPPPRLIREHIQNTRSPEPEQNAPPPIRTHYIEGKL